MRRKRFPETVPVWVQRHVNMCLNKDMGYVASHICLAALGFFGADLDL